MNSKIIEETKLWESQIISAKGPEWLREQYEANGIHPTAKGLNYVRRYTIAAQLLVGLQSAGARDAVIDLPQPPTTPKKATAPKQATPATTASLTPLADEYHAIINPLERGEFLRKHKVALHREARAATAQAKGPTPEGATLLQEYAALTGSAKVGFYRQHKTELVKAARTR
jgi:hypothetical protein